MEELSRKEATIDYAVSRSRAYTPDKISTSLLRSIQIQTKSFRRISSSVLTVKGSTCSSETYLKQATQMVYSTRLPLCRLRRPHRSVHDHGHRHLRDPSRQISVIPIHHPPLPKVVWVSQNLIQMMAKLEKDLITTRATGLSLKRQVQRLWVNAKSLTNLPVRLTCILLCWGLRITFYSSS